MRIQTNVDSLTAMENSSINSKKLSTSLEKLSSGLKVNKASDDASGLAIADKLRTQQSSLTQSINNATSAVAMIQIADKAMGEQSNILDIVKQKLIQASTATTSDEGRESIAKDINKLLTQLDNIAEQTMYNDMSLLQKSDGSATSSLTFIVGEKQNNQINTDGSIQSNTTGLGNTPVGGVYTLATLKSHTEGDGTDLTDTRASSYLEVVDNAISDLNTFRADFGSTQIQVESAMRNMMTQKTNIAAAESVIRDVDYASESADFNKFNLMTQSSTYAQAQANSRPNDVLRLLQ